MSRTTTWTEQGVIWKVDGVLHTQDILVFVEEAARSPRLNDLKYFLWDVTDVIGYVDDEDDVELSANYATSLELYNSSLIGALIAKTPAMLTLCEDYIQTMAEMKSPWVMKVFSELDDANNWIESKLS